MRYSIMKFVLPVLFLLTCAELSAQTVTCYFHVDKLTIKDKVVLDSTFAKRSKEKAISEFVLMGYTGLSLTDSLVKSSTRHYYFSYSGKFKKVLLENVADTSKKNKPERVNDFTAALNILDEQLTMLENNGYPFAQISIRSQKESADEIQFQYELDSGQFVLLDKITIKSKAKFDERTIQNIIDLRPGDVYNESKIASAADLINASGLYKMVQSVQIIFREGKAEMFLIIEKENSSDADGFVGFQQDKLTQKLALNGFINLSLINAFNRSEELVINWKNNPNKTQNLNVRFEYPYILKTPVGAGVRLNLQKQDSTFVRADAQFDLNFLQPYYRFGVFYLLESSSSLISTANINFRDYKKNTGGLTVRFNPVFRNSLKFYHPVISAQGGFFAYKADSVDQYSNDGRNTKYAIRYEHVIDFLKYFHLNNSIRYEGLTANSPLSRNELVYFGGLRSMRGFYELELNGNDVIIINNEIEFAPVDAISFKLLYDYSSYQNNGWNFAQAAGFGFTFSTGNIKLELILANGWENTSTPVISNTKIHLGFKSSF